ATTTPGQTRLGLPLGARHLRLPSAPFKATTSYAPQITSGLPSPSRSATAGEEYQPVWQYGPDRQPPYAHFRTGALTPTLATRRASVVVRIRMPEVPVMVTVTVPVVAVGLAVSVSVLVAVVGLGLKAAVTPLGSAEGDRVTLLVKPFSGETVIVLEPLLPWVTVTLLGEADRV